MLTIIKMHAYVYTLMLITALKYLSSLGKLTILNFYYNRVSINLDFGMLLDRGRHSTLNAYWSSYFRFKKKMDSNEQVPT